MGEFISQHQWLIWIFIAWSLPWKGVALWKAARREDRFWFIALFVLNTLALLDIAYIFFISESGVSSDQGESESSQTFRRVV